MYRIDFTKDELIALETQISGRITALKVLREEAVARKDFRRIIQLDDAMQPIISGRDKFFLAKKIK